MLLAFLATVAGGPPLAATERELVALAETRGPVTALRAYMAPDAWLIDAKLDPPQAVPAETAAVLAEGAPPVRWWPFQRTIASCDGSLAVATGTLAPPATPPAALTPVSAPAAGTAAAPTPAAPVPTRFFTVWERQADHAWKWVFQGPIADPAGAGTGASVPGTVAPPIVAACGKVGEQPPDPLAEASGVSGDGTLRWRLVRGVDRERHRLVIDYLAKGGWRTFEDVDVD